MDYIEEHTELIMYILQDSDEIDFSQIKNIGDLKSVKYRTFSSLGYWYFTVFFKDGTSKKIREYYSYSDWVEVKNNLQKIRDEILKSLL